MSRIHKGSLAGVALTLVVLLAAPALATTYVMVADEDMVDGSDLIARVRVTGIESVQVDGRTYTDYLVEATEVVKGTAGPGLRLRRPGGVTPDGTSLVVFGMPELAVGEDALVFLEPEVGGAREFKHYLLGAFHVSEVGGRQIAYRFVPEGDLMLQNPERARRAESLRQAHKPRDLDGFLGWIRQRVQAGPDRSARSGSDTPGDYYLDEPLPARSVSPFTLFEFGGSNLHRHEFSKSVKGSVDYFYNKRIRGASRGGVKALKSTLAAMSKIFNMDVDYGGKSRAAKGGLARTDGRNGVLTNDRTKEITGAYNCATGGVLAIGGIAAGGATGPTHGAEGTGKNRTYWDIIESDVVIQNGIECIRNVMSKALWDAFLAELFGHEIFHSFGAGHSCGDSSSGACTKAVHDQAIMRAFIHGDGRGAKFNRDDKKAAKALDYKG